MGDGHRASIPTANPTEGVAPAEVGVEWQCSYCTGGDIVLSELADAIEAILTKHGSYAIDRLNKCSFRQMPGGNYTKYFALIGAHGVVDVAWARR